MVVFIVVKFQVLICLGYDCLCYLDQDCYSLTSFTFSLTSSYLEYNLCFIYVGLLIKIEVWSGTRTHSVVYLIDGLYCIYLYCAWLSFKLGLQVLTTQVKLDKYDTPGSVFASPFSEIENFGLLSLFSRPLFMLQLFSELAYYFAGVSDVCKTGEFEK